MPRLGTLPNFCFAKTSLNPDVTLFQKKKIAESNAIQKRKLRVPTRQSVTSLLIWVALTISVHRLRCRNLPTTYPQPCNTLKRVPREGRSHDALHSYDLDPSYERLGKTIAVCPLTPRGKTTLSVDSCFHSRRRCDAS